MSKSPRAAKRPAVISSESPGRKNPTSRPVSAKTIAMRPIEADEPDQFGDVVDGGEELCDEIHQRLRRGPAPGPGLPCRSSMSSMPTDTRTRSSVMPIALPPLRRHRPVRHRGGVADQRLHAAEAFGQRHQPHAVEHRPRAFQRSDRERDHAAEPAHLPLRPARAAGATAGRGSGPAAPSDAPPGTRPARCALALCRSIRSGSVLVPRSTSHASIGPRMAPFRVLHEPQPLDVVVARRPPRCRRCCRCGRSGTWWCCAAPCRRRARAAAARTGWRRCCPRPPARRARAPASQAAAMSVMRSTGLVGVSRNSSFVFGRMAASQGVQVGGVDVGEVELVLAQHPLEQPVGAAVGVVGHHHVVARLRAASSPRRWRPCPRQRRTPRGRPRSRRCWLRAPRASGCACGAYS